MLNWDQHCHSLSAVKTATRCSNPQEFRDPHDPYTEFIGPPPFRPTRSYMATLPYIPPPYSFGRSLTSPPPFVTDKWIINNPLPRFPVRCIGSKSLQSDLSTSLLLVFICVPSYTCMCISVNCYRRTFILCTIVYTILSYLFTFGHYINHWHLHVHVCSNYDFSQ